MNSVVCAEVCKLMSDFEMGQSEKLDKACADSIDQFTLEELSQLILCANVLSSDTIELVEHQVKSKAYHKAS